nr:maestro heat-like repeat-containing protein family member 1 [Chelonoidis abingdonii]
MWLQEGRLKKWRRLPSGVLTVHSAPARSGEAGRRMQSYVSALCPMRLQTAINEHLGGAAELKPEELQVDICRHLVKENAELLENLYQTTITYFYCSWEEIWAVVATLAGIILEHTDTQRMKWLDLEYLLM